MIWIPLDEMRNAIWFAIIAFVAKEIWDIFKAYQTNALKETKHTIDAVMKNRYSIFAENYNEIVITSIFQIFTENGREIYVGYIEPVRNLVFAIMLYEDYNRSSCVRKTENIIHKIFGRKMSLGVMQIQSDAEINDEKSIELAISLLHTAIIKNIALSLDDNDYIASEKITNNLPEILKVYNGKKLYCEEIKNLYMKISSWEDAKKGRFDTAICGV